MLKNYWLIAWRTIRRHKGYTLLNIAGLAIGLAVFVTTLLYVNHETSYDNWDPQLQRVYRAGISTQRDNTPSDYFWTPYPLGEELLHHYTGAAAVTRIIQQGEQLVGYGDKNLYEDQIIQADSGFFTVFPYQFRWGNAAHALTQPNQAVLSTALSERLFGQGDPVGKRITVSTAYRGATSYTVSGVYEKTGYSHLNFNLCLSYVNKDPGYWGRQIYQTYTLFQPGVTTDSLAQQLTSFYTRREADYWFGAMSRFNKEVTGPGSEPEAWLEKNQHIAHVKVFFEPVSSIHLDPRAGGWQDAAASHPVLDSAAGNERPVWFFAAAAILILLLACINYINLATARAGKRARETGVRKVMGAGRRQLVIQFLAEALLQCLLALVAALLISYWLTNLIHQFFGLELLWWDPLQPQHNLQLAGELALVIAGVTLLSGAYPAFVLSGFRPARVLKGDLLQQGPGRRGHWLRNSLLVVQFTISACFLTALVVVSLQLQYMHHKNPGFNTSQVLGLHPANNTLISPGEQGERLNLIRDQLLRLPGVEAVAATGAYPGAPSMAIQEASFAGKKEQFSFNYIHFDYLDLLQMPVLQGRGFDKTYAQDSVHNALINETAARLMGLSNPIGQRVNILLRDYTIIGVVKDNFVAGYNTPVAPSIYAIGVQPGLMSGYSSLLVKINGKQAATTTATIRNYWKTLEPGYPLRYSWLDEDFARLLTQHERFGKLTAILSAVSLLIALIGIFALSAFAASRRTREIGIRKVFGASVFQLLHLLSRDFLVLVACSLVIAFPLAYWGMQQWLQDFAYRISLSWEIFLFTGCALTGIAWLTVSIQAWRAARANPVNSLHTT